MSFSTAKPPKLSLEAEEAIRLRDERLGDLVECLAAQGLTVLDPPRRTAPRNWDAPLRTMHELEKLDRQLERAMGTRRQEISLAVPTEASNVSCRLINGRAVISWVVE